MDLWRSVVDGEGNPQGEPQTVTTGIEMRTAVFTSDGTKLAYSRGRREVVSYIWRVPILGDRLATWADAEQLTFDNAFIQFFDVSPDGKRLVFSSDRAGNQDLWIVPSEGGEMVPLTTDPTPDWNPRWSPDGKEIAFYAYRSGNREIWVMPSDGGLARKLTDHPAEDVYPTWSPDGREIAFMSRRSGYREIWVVPSGGGEARHVTTDGSDGMPEWSPNGTWLGFRRDNSFVGARWDGTDRIERLVDGPGRTFRWSPDSKFIYYNGTRERPGLWEYSLEEGTERRLTDFVGTRGDLSFNLATDGRFLYFHWDEALADIWVMDVVQDR